MGLNKSNKQLLRTITLNKRTKVLKAKNGILMFSGTQCSSFFKFLTQTACEPFWLIQELVFRDDMFVVLEESSMFVFETGA